MNPSDFVSEVINKAQPLLSSVTKLTQTCSRPVCAKILLVFNHVIAQEPQATERLRVYAGRKVKLESPLGSWLLTITPAGLFEEARVLQAQDVLDEQEGAILEEDTVDLKLKVNVPTPLELGTMLLKGLRPPVSIEGDADLAAVFAWMGENLRWDYAEDLSHIVGDAPAHIAMTQLSAGVQALRSLLEAVGEKIGRFGR